jgi:hypothetical protein
MTARRWALVVGLGLFAVLTAAWAMRPWDDTHELAVPRDVAPQTVTYRCGAVWGQGSLEGQTVTRFPVIGKPCGHREERRRLAVADVVLASVGIVAVARWRRARAPVRV